MNFIHNNYEHDWKIGDWAYLLWDIAHLSEGSISKVTEIAGERLAFGFGGTTRCKTAFAPVLKGEEIVKIKNWQDLRLLRVFPEWSAHGSEVEPANMLGLAFQRTYAIAGWRNKPKPDTSHIEERIEKARQELEAAQRELKEMQG